VVRSHSGKHNMRDNTTSVATVGGGNCSAQKHKVVQHRTAMRAALMQGTIQGKYKNALVQS
jgi:Tfp pilus assembly protein PilW